MSTSNQLHDTGNLRVETFSIIYNHQEQQPHMAFNFLLRRNSVKTNSQKPTQSESQQRSSFGLSAGLNYYTSSDASSSEYTDSDDEESGDGSRFNNFQTTRSNRRLSIVRSMRRLVSDAETSSNSSISKKNTSKGRMQQTWRAVSRRHNNSFRKSRITAALQTSDHMELEDMFEGAKVKKERLNLAHFQNDMVDKLKKAEKVVSDKLANWEQQHADSDPVSELIQRLTELDNALEKSMSRLDERTRLMYEFQTDTTSVQQRLSKLLEEKRINEAAQFATAFAPPSRAGNVQSTRNRRR